MANKNDKQHHLGLKEAYSVLQKDFLNLQNHYTGIEQHLMVIQNNYLILEQSHNQLQQDCEEEKRKLIEKLEKSYDAYNEKYMEVEKLEDKIKEFSKSKVEENEQLNKDEDRNNKTSREVFEKETQVQTDVLVKKSLSEVGLSLVKTDEEFKVNLVDITKLEQLLSSEHCIVDKSVVNDLKDLKETNGLLEQSFYSLKQHSENQNKEMSKICEEFQKKTEECFNLNEEVNKMKNKNVILDISTQVNAQNLEKEVLSTGKNNVMMKREVVERVVARLRDMCDFTVEMKETILEQSSWIEVLMVSMNEYKASISQKQPGSQNKHCDISGIKIESDVTTHQEHPPLNANQSRPDEFTQYQNYSEAFSITENHFGDGKSSSRDVSIPLSSTESDGNELDYRGRLRLDHTARETSASQLSKTVTDEPGKQSKVRVYQTSNVDRSTTGGLTSEQQPHYLPTNDICPMCDVIFDTTYNLADRRTHINGHF